MFWRSLTYSHWWSFDVKEWYYLITNWCIFLRSSINTLSTRNNSDRLLASRQRKRSLIKIHLLFWLSSVRLDLWLRIQSIANIFYHSKYLIELLLILLDLLTNRSIRLNFLNLNLLFLKLKILLSKLHSFKLIFVMLLFSILS